MKNKDPAHKEQIKEKRETDKDNNNGETEDKEETQEKEEEKKFEPGCHADGYLVDMLGLIFDHVLYFVLFELFYIHDLNFLTQRETLFKRTQILDGTILQI